MFLPMRLFSLTSVLVASAEHIPFKEFLLFGVHALIVFQSFCCPLLWLSVGSANVL